jgi:hypothetical protein
VVDVRADESVVRELARAVVARVAPAELPAFRAVSDAYFADPRRALAAPDGAAGSGKPLGFGVGDVVVLLSPVALMVANEAVQHVAGELARGAVVRGRRAVSNAVRRLFGVRGKAGGDEQQVGQEDAAGEPRVELTPAQWAEVRRIVVAAAHRGGLPEETAQLVGDAVVGAGQVLDERPS